MFKRYITWTLVPGILVFGCQKVDVPDPVEVPDASPVFYSELNLGDASFNAQAGVDDFIMDASFSRNQMDGSIDLIGELKPRSCSSLNCAKSLKIIIRDRPVAGVDFDVDQLLSRNSLPFPARFSRDSAVVRFKPVLPDLMEATAFTWRINDEREIHNQRIVERVLSRTGDYLVKLSLNQQSCQSSQLQTIHLTRGGCSSRIRIDGRKAIVTSTGVPPFKYQWSDGSQDSVIILDATTVSNTKKLEVKVVDSRGCVSQVALGIGPGIGNDRFCQTIFEYESRYLEIKNRDRSPGVYLEIVDEQGNIYRSDGLEQPGQATFSILEVSDFERNGNGQKTKKIKARIKCMLSARDVPEKEIELSGQIVFAVAYPD